MSTHLQAYAKQVALSLDSNVKVQSVIYPQAARLSITLDGEPIYYWLTSFKAQATLREAVEFFTALTQAVVTAARFAPEVETILAAHTDIIDGHLVREWEA